MNAERSAALVRRWVALYTLGLPSEARRDRRDEIEDDLWCQTHEATTSGRTDRSLADEIVARFVLGIPADMSWRVEQGLFGRARPRPERSDAMNARTPATLALVGGASWLIFLAFALPLGILEGKYQGDPLPLLALFLGGTAAMVFATIGFVAAAQDMISIRIASLAVIGAMVVMVAVFGFPGIFFGPPLGSALLVWQLGRLGALPAWPSRAHFAAASIIVVGAAIGKASPLGQPGVVLILVAIALYAFTWMAIGWSLLRSRPAASDGIAGASAA